MPVEQSETFELSKWQTNWPDTSKQMAEALDFASSTDVAYERPESLYQRCISYVLGFHDKETDLNDIHKCILAALPIIRHKWPDVTLQEVRAELEDSLHLKFDVLDQAINIAVCLWLSLDCVGQKDGRPKNWPDADTINHFVLKRSFDDPTEASFGDSIARFPPKFRAARLKDISGINIESTWYLDQHLRFNEYTRTLKVFMDAAWLQFMCKQLRETRDSSQQESKEASGRNDLLHSSLLSSQSQAGASAVQSDPQGTSPEENRPESKKIDISLAAERCPSNKSVASGSSQAAKDLLPLFEETLRTLDVLFPAWDPRTTDFVADFGDQDSMVSKSMLEDLYPQQQQSLTKFKFWRARLTELIVEHQSPPRDWRQIWKDRRNPMAFWTFWIGLMIFLLTFLFGVIASVLTGLTYAQAKRPALYMPTS